LLKAAVLAALVKAVYNRRPFKSWTIPILLAAPFVIEDFRYGNAQLFIFALTAASLLLAPKRPLAASAALALGIAIKVWPLFFIPSFLVRNRCKVAAAAFITTIGLTLLPSIYFGFDGNLGLLKQWFNQ